MYSGKNRKSNVNFITEHFCESTLFYYFINIIYSIQIQFLRIKKNVRKNQEKKSGEPTRTHIVRVIVSQTKCQDFFNQLVWLNSKHFNYVKKTCN